MTAKKKTAKKRTLIPVVRAESWTEESRATILAFTGGRKI
jgi:hypothetical protein